MQSVYRQCVLAVFTNSAGEVLVGERSDHPGEWQLPQGGIDPGESPDEAIYREMLEEIGCQRFEILNRSGETIRYFFPRGLDTPIAKKYRGQDQVWFLLRFVDGGTPDLSKATDHEFIDFEWVSPQEAVKRAIDFKKDAYRDGFAALGIKL